MNKEIIKKKIRDFLYEENLMKEFENLKDDDSLLELGIIDSIKMLDLIEFIEDKFEITVNEEDLLPEYFDSINAITQYIIEQH